MKFYVCVMVCVWMVMTMAGIKYHAGSITDSVALVACVVLGLWGLATLIWDIK